MRFTATSRLRQRRVAAAAQRMTIGKIGLGELRAHQRVGVFVDLLRRFKVLVVAPIVLELAFIGSVVAADLRPSLVDPAAMILAEVLARRVNEQIPVFSLDEDRGPIVQQIPTNEIEITSRDRGVDVQGKVMAALCRAVFAQVGGLGKVLAATSCRAS